MARARNARHGLPMLTMPESDLPPSSEAAPGTETPRPRRRPRYSGTHPRRFHEKYKELDPVRYPETALHVMESGKTPAGMHRPICVAEILELLDPAPGMTVLDATLGYGGHSQELLRCVQPGGRLIGLDTDGLQLPRTEARLRALGYGPDTFTTAHTNYAGAPKVLSQLGLSGVDLVLADLGCSSMQIDDPSRGFSFKVDGPLDMRMNSNKGASAAQWLARVSESELATALRENADEPEADRIAAGLCRSRVTAPLKTTSDLRQALCRALPDSTGRIRNAKDPALEPAIRRVFQAIRIAVNDEFSALDTFLRHLPSLLLPGGKAAILTFHSGEDRRVKQAFKNGRNAELYSEIAEEVVRPSEEECRSNPRASSAKLRWAVRRP